MKVTAEMIFSKILDTNDPDALKRYDIRESHMMDRNFAKAQAAETRGKKAEAQAEKAAESLTDKNVLDWL